VLDEPPRYLTGEEILAQINTFISDTDNYGKLHNWKFISCFWQLPYFHKLLLRHDINMMHNEKNVAEAIWKTCMDIPEKTKDNVKARRDLAQICSRPSQNLRQKPNGNWDRTRGPFCIDKKDKPAVHQCYKELKFPDGMQATLEEGLT
jgi:hypothetical protein